jgi:PAS domain S-box-containing protein
MKTRTKEGKILTGLFSAEIIESQGKQLFLTVMVDITSLLETKSALKKSEHELRAFLRAIPDLLFIFDQKGHFEDVYVEDDSRLFFPSAQLKGRHISEFFDEKISGGAIEAFQKSIKENSLVTYPYMIEVQGKEEYYEARIVPTSNHQVLCMVRDVTDELNALRTLQHSEQESRRLQELFRNIADNMPDMLWAKDIDKRFLFVNKAISDKLLHAETTEEPIGKTDMFFAERERNLFPDDKQWHTFGEICRDSDSVVLESGETGQFDEFGNIRGEFLFLDVVKSPLKDSAGRIIGTVGAARDVTDRKQMEKVNLDQQRQIRLLGKAVEQSPVSIIITNRDGVIEYVNPKFSEITGYFAAEAIGKNPRILKSGLMDASFYKCLWDDLLAGRQWFGEMQNRRKNGELFWEFSSISPILDEQGEITHFVAVKEDVTDHKKLISDFIEAKNKAIESDRLKSAFLMNMSHEIRTPLNGIMGFSSLLATGDFEPAEVSYYAGIINKNSNRLLELINNIVDLSKIDAGTAQAELSTMSPSSRLNEIVHRFSAEIEKSYLGVRVTIPEEYYFCTFDTDALKFDQIMSSLLSNAIKFTRAGEIELGFSIAGEEIIFFVKDTGIGIAQENFLNIFDRFYQVDNSLSRGHEGAGLGLPICKGYTELLGGKIWVESEFGAGATFFVSLPFKMKENLAIQGKEEESSSSAPLKQHVKVLVVEDEVSIYQFISIVLKKREYTILHAVDGTEAITLYKNSKNIDLILMDMKMPIMDGYKATRIIRSMNPDIPIVAITAYAMAGDREKVMQAGCTDYLPKPIRKVALLNMVDKYI